MPVPPRPRFRKNRAMSTPEERERETEERAEEAQRLKEMPLPEEDSEGN